jgi:hypothetical protein
MQGGPQTTLTVLERLCYLEGRIFWQVLQRSLMPDVLPIRTVAELEEFTLWPRWNSAMEQLGQGVEPDALLRFKVGDPTNEITLIVEAKLGDMQNADQWAREWTAYRSESKCDQPDAEGEFKDVYFVALGGLDDRPASCVQKLADEANKIIAARGGTSNLKAVGADWSDLATTISELTRQVSMPNQRVLRDLTEALALCGYRPVVPLAELGKETLSLRPISDPRDSSLRFKL